jgi:hypothetical protein
MNHLTDLAAVAAAIGFSVGFALSLEWLVLRGLMRLMPARTAEVEGLISEASRSRKESRAKAARGS